jgi:hypothetical protein
MIQKRLFYLISIFLSFTIVTGAAVSQESSSDSLNHLQEKAVKVFLDISRWYQDYIKTEIPFVNYVRDRNQAEVFVMMTYQRTGSGGSEYTLTLSGQRAYAGQNDTLIYNSKPMDTFDERRAGIVRTLKLGLMRYVSKTPLADHIDIRYEIKTDPTDVKDKWNNWVFNFRFGGYTNGEESRNRYSFYGTFSIDRVTPAWKMAFSLRASYNESNFDYEDYKASSFTRSQSFESLVVKSLSEHWSIGLTSEAYSSTYSNYEFYGQIAPAIEFNIFPYSESTRREFRILWGVGYGTARYMEETIYDKFSENLVGQRLTASFEVREKWGSLQTFLIGSHYFHDFDLNRLHFSTDLSLRLFEGFSFNIEGGVSMIHDQLSLPKQEASTEELLLYRKQLATQYNYFFELGFRFTFGSIYSNIVNPRFGSGRGYY